MNKKTTTKNGEKEAALHRLQGGYVIVGTEEADPDNGWDAAVTLTCSLDHRSYATPEVARAIAADLLAAADAVVKKSL